MKIKLEELARAFAQSDVRQGYVDISRGCVVFLESHIDEEASLEHVFSIETDWEHFIPLPNVMDHEQIAIMKGFAESCPREDTKERLKAALEGRGAATRFNHQVHRLLLKPAFDAYRHQKLRELARDWCEENLVEYEE